MKARSLKQKRNDLERIRMVVQVGFFLVAPAVYHSAFAAVKQAATALGQGKPLEWNEFTLQFVLLIALTICFGRYFCGWACAFGAVNDWVYKLSQLLQKRFKKKLPALPDPVIPYLQWLKYLVLLVILLLCFFGLGNVVNQNSPWTTFSLIRSGHFTLAGYAVSLILLLLLLAGMACHERFFCQFFCPLGAVFSLIPVLPFLGPKRSADQCPERCGACRRVCPVSLLLEADSPKQGECIRCGRCILTCPKKNIRL